MPGMGKALYIESVEQAAALAGGREQLAAALGVSVDEVERWCAGSAIPECAVFLRLLEIALGADPRGATCSAGRGSGSRT